MTILEAQDLVLALRARARMEAQHGMPRELTLSGKAAEAIEFLLAELEDAERDAGSMFCPYCD
jgi:hypothetical protein